VSKKELELPSQKEGASERAESLNFRSLARIISYNVSKLRVIEHTVGKGRISHLVVLLVVVVMIIGFTVSLFTPIRHRGSLNNEMIDFGVV
jgi:hypothetical protein